MSESLIAKWLDDRTSLTDDEAAGLERALAADPDAAARVKDQLATEELLSRRLGVDRANFEAQVAHRIAAGDGGRFTRSTLAAVRRVGRWKARWPEAAAAALLVAGLLFLLVRSTPPGAVPAAAGSTGLRAEYFRNQFLQGEATVRTDPRIDFAWRKGAGPIMGWGDVFSARWTGKIVPRSGGRTAFRTENDDGVRVWIDGKSVIDDWTGRMIVGENRGEITLEAGKPVDFRVEYFNGGDIGVLRLYWSSAGQKEEIVPSSQLSPP